MKKWLIVFNENGGEYMGELIVTAKEILQVGDRSFTADGVHIEIDECIISIEER